MKKLIGRFAAVALAAGFFAACDSSTTAPVMERNHDIVISGPSGGKIVLPTKGLNGEDIAVSYVDEKGGTLSVGGHTLKVPAGAVKQPTWFVMSVIADTYVHVRLKAWTVSGRTPVTTFPVPVQLTLSAANLLTIPDGYLAVGYLVDGTVTGRLESQPSQYSAATNSITGWLSHFSEYVILFDREPPPPPPPSGGTTLP